MVMRVCRILQLFSSNEGNAMANSEPDREMPKEMIQYETTVNVKESAFRQKKRVENFRR